MFAVYIPARAASQRLPGKMLADLGGEPVIRRTCRAALAAGPARVVVATDHADIVAAVADLPVAVELTNPDLPSGTDRIAEAARRVGESGDAIIVNLQGDEPFMPVDVIVQVAGLLAAHHDAGMATVCVPFSHPDELTNPNVVKVVRDRAGMALYFSRAAVPVDRDAKAGDPLWPGYRRHIGLYAYRMSFLQRFVALPPAPLEQLERLEQLRAMYYGHRIVCADAAANPGVSIDTAEDLAHANVIFAGLTAT